MIKQATKGFSFIEVLVVVAIVVAIFAGLFSMVTASFNLLAHAKAKTTATSIANGTMEYIRSLPYDSVGTISGIPPGSIPQTSTTTLNNILFTQRVLVEFVDDPADGMLTATTTDGNGIPSDYKRVKIEISWNIRGEAKSISLVSNVVPRSIETTAGGGTVRVNVLDANSMPLPGVQVRLINNTTTSTIDVLRNSDISGTALFSGAPAASNYEVIVTAPGYSTDRTYVPTALIPNPITAPFSVLLADISTVTFQIDRLSDISLKLFSSFLDAEDMESFLGTSGIATSTNTEVGSGVLRLQDTAGVYPPSGIAYLTPVAPPSMEGWKTITVAAATPTNTEYKISLYTLASSTYALIPDSDLPGNSAGFVGPVIDISDLDEGAYPQIIVGIQLVSSNSSVTPTVDEIAVYYRQLETPRVGTAISLQGDKVIGTDLSAQPIFKTVLSGITDSNGELEFIDVEFDTYDIGIPANLTIASACPAAPIVHRAGIDSITELLLVPQPAHSLRVTAIDAAGQSIPGAVVTLSRSGFTSIQVTDTCGQAYFGSGVVAESDYSLTIEKNGFVTVNQSAVSIAGNNDTTVTITP